MKQLRYFLAAVALVPLMGLNSGVSHAESNWAIKGQFTHSCSCNSLCPCLFGSPPTHDHCQGSHLLEIKKGHYGDVKLDGLAVVGTRNRPHWLKVYVDESASDAQMDALLKVLKMDETLGGIYAGKIPIVSQEKVKIAVDRTSERVKFSVPASTVEIEIMKGIDGKPITVHNLGASFMQGLTVYKSISNTHQSNEDKFSHAGTNASVSWLKAASKPVKE